ncbi:MAG: type IV pilus twitching motility protein PilT [Sulfurovaceae bacterium]|nr:type IV pilus twitching motility protein PilT [Sulfurovaceae bacterium]
MSEQNLSQLLQDVITRQASDLHLISRSKPLIRIDGQLEPVDAPELTGKDIEEMCFPFISDKQKKHFEEEYELDFSFELKGIGRFRVNYYHALGEMCAAFRPIPIIIPSLDDLGSPPIYKKLIKREKGIILVTGPTGSGKSTTLAAMLNEINEYQQKHIVTAEDPVEFVHTNKKSVFSHREVGNDTASFANALKYAMRQDPDVILVGEMRDKETIAAALTAAETGHLVFATLHTNSAPSTLNRIIDVFPGEEQPQVRAMLSTSLVAVIAQSLIPKIKGGRIVASEIMIMNHAIANLIRDEKVHQIYSQMQLGQEESGMQTQTQVLVSLVKQGIISKENAIQYSNKPDELFKLLPGGLY